VLRLLYWITPVSSVMTVSLNSSPGFSTFSARLSTNPEIGRGANPRLVERLSIARAMGRGPATPDQVGDSAGSRCRRLKWQFRRSAVANNTIGCPNCRPYSE